MTTSPNEPFTTGDPGEPGLPPAGGGTGYLPPPAEPVSTTGTDDTSTSETARDEAKNVKDATAGAAQDVAGTAKEQVGQVTSEVRDQARMLADETKGQLNDQAASQRDRAVGGLRSLGNELQSMCEQTSQNGMGSQLAREGASLTHKTADFLEQRDPGQLVDEVRDFARRKPGTFLLGAAVAGVVVGRLTRGAISAQSSSDDGPSSDGSRYATQTSAYPPPHGDPLATTGQPAGWGQGTQSAPVVNEPYPQQPATEGYAEGSGYRS